MQLASLFHFRPAGSYPIDREIIKFSHSRLARRGRKRRYHIATVTVPHPHAHARVRSDAAFLQLINWLVVRALRRSQQLPCPRGAVEAEEAVGSVRATPNSWRERRMVHSSSISEQFGAGTTGRADELFSFYLRSAQRHEFSASSFAWKKALLAMASRALRLG